jgi:ACS family tartrate transporter-like MFS transporter
VVAGHAASRLSGKGGGAAIAIVNSWGAMGAFAGPYAMGWLHDATHKYSAGLWAIAACLACGAIAVEAVRDKRQSAAEKRGRRSGSLLRWRFRRTGE